MGACYSCEQSSKEGKLKTIRVVHLDGSVDDYVDPATVEQVIGNFPKHFLCTPIQILQDGLVPLQPNHQLETGQTYFMLPNSTLSFNASPMDLTSLTRKLTNIAKTSRCTSKSAPASPSASPLWASEPSSPNRFLDRRPSGETREESMLNSPKSPLWKPILAPITEVYIVPLGCEKRIVIYWIRYDGMGCHGKGWQRNLMDQLTFH
ncbi:hypothetical protein L2E82_12338 [Cichorium intybus]|uniref:Uncharacterized protein n=1 Tax=Cichorium intybus TaxID=13427 RepID=A0ACB9GGX5_CICIN|nr:hypothetical protein L2E82_12338 [Cichorium intybus]